MIENEINSTLQFNTGLDRNKKLYRDRFIFPEVWVGVFRDNDEIIEKIEAEIEKRMREKMINNISSEVILKNVAGPFLDDLSTEEKEILLSIVEEMRKEKINKSQYEPVGSASGRKASIGKESLQAAIIGAEDLLKKEALRAGDASVRRDFDGKLSLEGNPDVLEGRILEIRDDE